MFIKHEEEETQL